MTSLAKIIRLAPALVCIFLMSGISLSHALDPFYQPNFFPRNVIGHWSLQLGWTKHVVSLNKDRTFAGICYINGNETERYNGTWSLNEQDHLTWTYAKGPAGREPGFVDADRVMAATADSIMLKGRKSPLRTWYRVPQPGAEPR